MKGPVEAFALSISLRVVRSGPRLLDVIQITQLLNYCVFKTAALDRV